MKHLWEAVPLQTIQDSIIQPLAIRHCTQIQRGSGTWHQDILRFIPIQPGLRTLLQEQKHFSPTPQEMAIPLPEQVHSFLILLVIITLPLGLMLYILIQQEIIIPPMEVVPFLPILLETITLLLVIRHFSAIPPELIILPMEVMHLCSTQQEIKIQPLAFRHCSAIQQEAKMLQLAIWHFFIT